MVDVKTSFQVSSLRYDDVNKQTTSFKIGELFCQAPAYLPEIKGDEDLTVLLQYERVLPKGNPIIVPSYKWLKLINIGQKNLLNTKSLKDELLTNHSIIFYDPPELFRYVYNEYFLRYILYRIRNGKRTFTKYLQTGSFDNAIKMVEPFFQPFLETQLGPICKKEGIAYHGEKPDFDKAWLDERVALYLPTYICNRLSEASTMPNATIIPPVPQLNRQSSNHIIERIFSSNMASLMACKKWNSIPENKKKIFPYAHLYIDLNILDSEHDNNRFTATSLLTRIIDRLNVPEQLPEFSGVAITFVGLAEAINNNHSIKLKNFIIDLNNICQQHKPFPLPLIFPRTGWFGLYFTDYGLQGFSSLLNGKLIYPRGGADIKEEQQYGYTPLIDTCEEIDFEKVIDYLKENLEFPNVHPDLPRTIPIEIFKLNIKKRTEMFRILWSKPWRLIHSIECQRIRDSKTKGQLNPARHYFQRSNHRVLSNF